MSFIIPSRWFAGGKGLDNFRQDMLNDTRMKCIVDYPNASECFPGVEIKGGVCYFLWESNYNGMCSVSNGKTTIKRNLNEYDVFTRNNQSLSILKKVRNKATRTLDSQVSNRKPFGFATNFNVFSKVKNSTDNIEIYARGTVGYIAKPDIPKNKDWIGKWKVLTAMAADGSGAYPIQVTGKPIVASNNSCCTETYLVCGLYNTKLEAENLSTYMKTRFFRFLVSLRKNTQHLTAARFSFVPSLDMKEEWTDEKLYKRYNFTQDEINFIESMIKEMP